MTRKSRSIAIVGSGVAGATLAYTLASEGHGVHVFDKARGPGGRMATRRLEGVDREGHAVVTQLDHGAVGFTASDPAFQAFVDRGLRAGVLTRWSPLLAPSGLPGEGGSTFYVPTPQMPSLCRYLLDGVPTSLSFTVDGLNHGAAGWQVWAGAVRHDTTFDAVLLAVPPAQAAPLLTPHRPDWASQAATAEMQPCWTLMGVANDAGSEPAWGLAQPPAGPLAWAMRNDTRPGRVSVPGQAHWVAHARLGWSLEHLEQPAAWVQQHMQTALAELVGRPIEWQHSTVHRWRYAMPQAHGTEPSASCWWDASPGLGVCGDFLGGRGVEGAWLSAQALSAAVLQTLSGESGAAYAEFNAHLYAEAGCRSPSMGVPTARGPQIRSS